MYIHLKEIQALQATIETLSKENESPRSKLEKAHQKSELITDFVEVQIGDGHCIPPAGQGRTEGLFSTSAWVPLETQPERRG